MPLIEDMRRYGTRWLPDEAEPRSRAEPSPRTPSAAILQARRAGAGAPGAEAEAWDVRDFLLNEALKRLAAEAATRLSALVASGEQIPFDVAEQDGPDSAFYSYVPLTARFVREREEELRVAARPSPPPATRSTPPASPRPTWRPAARRSRPTPASAPRRC